MSEGSTTYLLDSDSFIRSKQQHYAFDICPGYWNAVIAGFNKGRLLSVGPVREELLRGNDALAQWVEATLSPKFFLPIDDPKIVQAYKRIIKWANECGKYKKAVVSQFAECADPWLIAAASVNGFQIVTYEVSGSITKVKIPDAARAFGVKCIAPYSMLRQLSVVLSLQAD